MLTRDQLREDQKEAIDWLRYRTEAFVLLGVGFGKTIVTLTALRDINDVLALHGQDRYRALVVSTKNIVEHTWPDEIQAWEHTRRHFRYASAAGRSHAAIDDRPDILGVNFESLEWFLDQADVDPSFLPDVLIIDESSKMKSHTAKRVKRLSGIGGRARRLDDARPPRGYVHRFKRRFALSATPAPEGYAGLWSQEACISMARRLGRNVSEFRRRYCHSHWNGFAHTYTVSKDGERAIEQALAPITYTPAGARYLDLPDPIQSEITVPWTKEAREQYDAIENDAFTLLEEGPHVLEDEDLDDPERTGTSFDVASVASRINKLRQACSGFVYDDEGHARWLSDPGAKLRALEAVCERAAESPVLVFTQYIAEAEAIGSHFGRAVVGLPRSLDDWNAGRVPMLVLHPRSAGHGLNLQHGSHVCVFYSLPWGYEDFYQGYGRLHRGGQTKQVSVLRLIRSDSVEEDVWGKITAKERKLEQFIGSMRSRRRGREE